MLFRSKPDGDTLGSAAALCLALRKKGKTAYIHDSQEVTERFFNIEKSYYAPIEFLPDFVVGVDIADTQLLPENGRKFQDNIELSIDHHPSNKEFAGHNYIDDKASATGEIIYDVINKMQIELDKEILTNIYISVSTDTGCFCYANTSAKAHIIAANAIDAGVDIGYINKRFFETKSIARIAIEREIYNNVEYFYDNKLAVSLLSRDTIDKYNATEDDLDNISALLRKIAGIECAIIITEQNSGSYKLSIRSGDKVDASMVCSSIGGGGHKRAAGATITKEEKEVALDKIIELIGEELNA